jgi:hypothetical protein
MFEGMSKRIGEAATRLRDADSETLWAEIQRLASGQQFTETPDFSVHHIMAAHILMIAKHEGWSVLHTALALAYVHMILSDDHLADLNEMTLYMQKPMIVHNHCAGCTCEDKVTRWENA